MKIRHLGHACVLVEVGARRVVIDPGTYSAGLDDLPPLDVVAVTHDHADHADPVRLPRILAANPDATLVASPPVLPRLPRHGESLAIAPGASARVKGVDIAAGGSVHAEIHPLLPNVANTGFLIDRTVWHPGDSFEVPDHPVGILLLPIGGPWMRLGEAIDYVRAIEPAVCIPIHEAGLSSAHQALHHHVLASLVPASVRYVELDAGGEFVR